ncbi:helix-turn-helix domain-containing protein [Bacillus sp. BP-3]|uniref:helix-turn-helix domain-containing protein n=1 Tax=Bacillus sp. BP-3 TaxID=3022773 RepID=UPI00232B3605|nr:helix-turn-helix transcriptional regulator [Bacillus sp. BP-3]MDC2863821.1 helix-turn-helix transcriptional regulator [Bacillus sp. BP-3]
MYVVGKCRLNEILEEKKLSQIDLALKLGMKKQQVNAYATNDRIMSYQTAKNIASQLNVNMEELYDFIQLNEQ